MSELVGSLVNKIKSFNRIGKGHGRQRHRVGLIIIFPQFDTLHTPV